MKAKLILSLLLLFVAVVFMFVAIKYFFLYLNTGNYAWCVFFYTWAGLGAFYGALRIKLRYHIG